MAELKRLTKAQLKKYKKEERYVGTRPSPPYHANDIKNIIIEGQEIDENGDYYEYKSVPDKNNTYHWVKIKSMDETKSPKEFYNQLKTHEEKYDITPILNKLKTIKQELKKHNIILLQEIPWKDSYNWIDHAWDTAIEKVEKNGKRKNIVSDVSFIFYTAKEKFWAHINGELNLQHNIASKEDVKIIVEIFKKHFGSSLIEKGSPTKTIKIKLQKKK